MEHIITVKGVGSASARPDYITLSLGITAKDKVYAKAAEKAAARVQELRGTVQLCGFEADDLKTGDFRIRTCTRSVRGSDGSYSSVFDGYECSYRMKLSFDFSQEVLSQLLGAVGRCKALPELGITFALKDPAAVREELLRSAAQNARHKAEVLCAASGARLGQLVTIDYNWGEIRLESPTDLCTDPMVMRSVECACIDPDLIPEDIEATDTVAFVWELL